MDQLITKTLKRIDVLCCNNRFSDFYVVCTDSNYNLYLYCINAVNTSTSSLVLFVRPSYILS